jgi:hypothetical protein
VAGWDFWFSRVKLHAADAPDPLVAQALIDASREFFKRTRVWMEWLDPSDSTAGLGVEYDFELPSQTELVRIERATRNGKDMPVNSYREQRRDWTQYPQGEPSLVSRDMQSFVLTGEFPAGDRIQVQVSLMPSLRAAGIPDYLATRYLVPIAEGAKAIVLLTPDVPYNRPDLAGLAASKFEEAIGACAMDAYRGHTNQVPRANPKWC